MKVAKVVKVAKVTKASGEVPTMMLVSRCRRYYGSALKGQREAVLRTAACLPLTNVKTGLGLF